MQNHLFKESNSLLILTEHEADLKQAENQGLRKQGISTVERQFE